MTFETTLFKVDVSSTERGREFWVTRAWVSATLAPQMRSADILIAPLVNFREGHEVLFPSGTTDFMRDVARELPGQLVIIAVDEGRYEEIVLHSKQVRWPTMLVSLLVFPLLVNALTEIAKKKWLDERSRRDTIELSVIVEGKKGHCIEIKYNGPADELAKTLLEQSEACLRRLENDDQKLKHKKVEQ